MKDIIRKSEVEVNNINDIMDGNTIPVCGGESHQVHFEYADSFIEKYGEQEAHPVTLEEIEPNEPAEGLGVKDGFGNPEDYEWYRTNEGTLFGVWGGPTYDVVFDGDTSSNAKGFRETYQYCRDYIKANNGTDESYFADYKGGVVSIVCNEEETGGVHEEVVR